jgi:predicted AAA+ superfamily ATPase
MSTLQRYLVSTIQADLAEKMVFLGGPRQVGKTTLAKDLLAKAGGSASAYLNWDSLSDRQIILKGGWSSKEDLIVFDEVHKFAKWRGLLKGYYDKLSETHQFLVTGSARLDYYRKSGDSLLGRYHYLRLHPFSLPELQAVKPAKIDDLLMFGGFPEPMLRQSRVALKRWHLQRRERIIYSDVRDLERLNEISSLELLAEALPERVGAPLSRKNLARDLSVDFKTVERWLSILENVYYCYRIAPFGAPKIRAVKKEQKLYLWDWSEINDDGARWENFVGSHLLKFCHYQQDVFGDRMELRFLRDTQGREVDFVVIKNRKPLFAVECKAGEKQISPHIRYFAERTPIPHFYQVHRGVRSYAATDRIQVIGFEDFCSQVGLV